MRRAGSRSGSSRRVRSGWRRAGRVDSRRRGQSGVDDFVDDGLAVAAEFVEFLGKLPAGMRALRN